MKDSHDKSKEKPVKEPASESGTESCRCKEVSKKTPAGLLKLMLQDLKKVISR